MIQQGSKILPHTVLLARTDQGESRTFLQETPTELSDEDLKHTVLTCTKDVFRLGYNDVEQNTDSFPYQQGRAGTPVDWRLRAGSAQCQLDKGTPVLESLLEDSSIRQDTVQAVQCLQLSHTQRN